MPNSCFPPKIAMAMCFPLLTLTNGYKWFRSEFDGGEFNTARPSISLSYDIEIQSETQIKTVSHRYTFNVRSRKNRVSLKLLLNEFSFIKIS